MMIRNQNQYGSLSRNLVLWFLLLSLLPLIIVSWVSFQQANSSLTISAIGKLEHSSLLRFQYIKSWFEYRFMDLSLQAESANNSEMLINLNKGLKLSGKPAIDYVKSFDWVQRVDSKQHDLITMTRNYDYIYDLFLINSKGTILYSIAAESGLGTNLFDGPYSNTLFAKSVRSTLKNGLLQFSDFERYQPSNNIIAGFITAPLLDESGNKIGVFAIQIRLNRILNLFQNQDQSLVIHYIVGDDGKLRSNYKGSNEDILRKVIATDQVRLWKNEHGIGGKEIESQKESVFTYPGPELKAVIGLHQSLRIKGINWTLISEINESDALASANWLGKITLLLVFITALVVLVIAVYKVRRIVNPIKFLVEANRNVAEGDLSQSVTVSTNNEIGKLEKAFNYMIHRLHDSQDALEQSNRRTKNALTNVQEKQFAIDQHAIVAVTDVKGNISYVNDKFCDISGFNRDELLGNNHRLLNSGYHPVSFFKGMYHCISNGVVWHNEICNKAKDGHLYWVDTTIVPTVDENGKPKSYIAIRTDISKIKESEKVLSVAKEIAEETTRLKSEFLANMSHEIRTPMNGVIGMTGLLLDTELSSKQRTYVQNTMKSADSLLTIINDILDFSKIEAGKLELELLPFDLQNLVEDVAEIMSFKCREKNLEMLLRFKPGTRSYLLGDPGRIRQILLNLLSNAVKFTDKGNILLTIGTGDVVNNKVAVHVSVTDTGIGIANNKLEKIFNKFDQEDGSTTRKYGGTGLGLAICQQLCQVMNGKIKVSSVRGQGSCFSFNITLELADESNFPLVQIGNIEKLKGLKILVVDDIEIARIIICEQLAVLNVNIETASSGKQAITLLKNAIENNTPFDIVLTDYQMPKMDGEMLAIEIKNQKLHQDGIMIFITSSPRKGDGHYLKEKGFDGYLIKPISGNEVVQVLSLIYNSKLNKANIPMVTRHTLREAKKGSRISIKLTNTSILLVEDNHINLMVATEYLEALGCIVTPAGNGLEALVQVKQQKFDLIFMDCLMPEMDGFDATKAIRDLEMQNKISYIPIIAFTANAMQGDKEKCLDSGMDDYISKPVNQKLLENILSKWLPENVKVDTKIQDMQGSDNFSNSTAEIVELNIETFNNLKELFKDKFQYAVEQHVTNIFDNTQRLKQAIEHQDNETLERLAHSIKGASAQFGALVLSKLATEMELLARNNDIEHAMQLFTELSDCQEQVAQLMQRHLDDNAAKN
jgi:PAS domain S-box-containing protein